MNNVERAHDEGLVSDEMVTALSVKLRAAAASHARGAHPTEWVQLNAFVNLLAAQAGKGVDQPLADRLSAYATHLVAARG